MYWNWYPTLKPTTDMFNSIVSRTGRKPGRPETLFIFRLILALFFVVILWAVRHYEFGFYFDHAHSGRSRIYRINSYEQFMKENAVDGASLLA